MRIVTFPKGMMVRHVIKWMVLEHDRNQRVEIRSGRIRRLPDDMVYPLEDDLDWIQAAHDLAAAYGLVLYRCKLGIWRVRTQTWKALKADILRERDG